MSDTEERVLVRALHALVTDPVVPADLADRVQRRYRRHQARLAAGVALAAVLAVAGGLLLYGMFSAGGKHAPSYTDGQRPTNRFIRDTLRDARFTERLAFDGGALTIAPPPDRTPAVGEQQAIAAFRSTGMPQTRVGDVIVGYGTVTLASDLGAVAARLDRHPAWVVIVSSAGPIYCGKRNVPPPPLPEGRQVFLLDAAGNGNALRYRERGSSCGRPPTGPKLDVAEQVVSIPWMEVGRSGNRLTVRYLAGCMTVVGPQLSADPQRQEITLYAARAMQIMHCAVAVPQTTELTLPYPNVPLVHAPTGPVTGLFTGDFQGFDYVDGRR